MEGEEAESILVVTRGWEEGKMELFCMYKVLVLQDE